MKTIHIVFNEQVPQAAAASERLQAWCRDHEVACCDGPPGFAAADLIVALGGDGTLLRAVHATHQLTAPFLSIKFGRLGFLSGAPADQLIEAVSTALFGDAPLELHTMIEARLFSGDQETTERRVLNELVLHTLPGRMLTTTLIINGHTFSEFSGDGLIIATATGSTAYALSAGGPVLTPSFEGMEVVPLAPHSLINRAVVTAPGDLLRIELSDPRRADALPLLDGETLRLERPVTAVELSVAPEKLRLVKFGAHNSYEVVAQQFFGLPSRETEHATAVPTPCRIPGERNDA
ncbi:MAG: NAD(+)/NADH kinase [Actinomycetia bacterium]|nr:NAD(+)/NADH kinase [Actinomycetes bacterium]